MHIQAFAVLTVVKMMTACEVVGIYRCFRETYCIHLHGVTTQKNINFNSSSQTNLELEVRFWSPLHETKYHRIVILIYLISCAQAADRN
jgi:hypothetical protein